MKIRGCRNNKDVEDEDEEGEEEDGKDEDEDYWEKEDEKVEGGY